MSTICGIYKITSPSKKIYIGQSADIISRWNKYKTKSCKRQTKIYNSIQKHGWEKHKFEIICQCDVSDLIGLEIYYIDLFNTFNSEHGMNLRGGGGYYGKMSDETKKKIGISNRYNKRGLGKKRTALFKTEMSNRKKGVSIKSKIAKHYQYIKDNLHRSQYELAKELNISQSTISKLKKKWAK